MALEVQENNNLEETHSNQEYYQKYLNYCNQSNCNGNYQIATKIDLLVSKFLRLKEQNFSNYSEWEEKEVNEST